MSPTRIAVAAGNSLGAEAAATIAASGGNAVDACLASSVMAWVAEPCLASLGGSGFVVIRTPDGSVEIVDGNTAMPNTLPDELGQGQRRVYFPDYSDGMWTGVGAGAVAVPGVLAAVSLAWERHGRIEWPALFQSAIEAARAGIPFSRTSAYYVSRTWNELWSNFDSAAALFAPGGKLLDEGDVLVQAELAETLELIADQGQGAFYSGEVGSDIAEALGRAGGFLTLDDLGLYRPEVRAPVHTRAFGWTIESNPPPAVGGAVLMHMLALLDGAALDEPLERLRSIVHAQREATGYRRERYDDAADIAGALDEALAGLRRTLGSPSTTHTSTADSDGYACGVTESGGYGSGMVVDGILLNNTLGEEELNPLGTHRLPPGSRCHSNMAPTVASGAGRTVALGSPGADRIVGAIAQTIVRLAVDGDDLEAAVAGARAHLDPRENGETLCFEPGLPGDRLGYATRPYDDLHMYFGGVQAASVTDDGRVDAAHDPRRSGASAVI